MADFGLAKRWGLVVAVPLVGWVAHALYKGLSMRLRIRRLKAQGIPILEHSFLFGHLMLLKRLQTLFPKDANIKYCFGHVIQEWKEYFPTATECPPMLYLDMWPIMSELTLIVVDPQCCAQFTQDNPQPRPPATGWAFWPLLKNNPVLAMDLTTHKKWRAKYLPSFSPKNIVANMQAMLEEVEIFVHKLKTMAGDDGEWGDMFVFHEQAVSLTLDIIVRFTLGTQLHDQTIGPTPFRNALRAQLQNCRLPSLWTRLDRMRPSFKKSVEANDKIMREALQPRARLRLEDWDETGNHKTVIDLALKEVYAEESGHNGKEIDEKFLDSALDSLKMFLFAGHETTALAICKLLWDLQESPEVLEKLRFELKEVLGSDPKELKSVLITNPHKLNDLRYTTAVIKESLRHHNLGITFRRGSPEFSFTLGGKRYPTDDCFVQTQPHAMNFRPDLWPRPKEFLPERYLVAEGHELYPVKNAYRPFELGNTICIGQEIAMTEIKLVLAFLLAELDFDINYQEWYKVRNVKPDIESVDGDLAYFSGMKGALLKEGLPIRFRLRESV